MFGSSTYLCLNSKYSSSVLFVQCHFECTYRINTVLGKFCPCLFFLFRCDHRCSNLQLGELIFYILMNDEYFSHPPVAPYSTPWFRLVPGNDDVIWSFLPPGGAWKVTPVWRQGTYRPGCRAPGSACVWRPLLGLHPQQCRLQKHDWWDEQLSTPIQAEPV